jgi:hypothetical protein
MRFPMTVHVKKYMSKSAAKQWVYCYKFNFFYIYRL